MSARLPGGGKPWFERRRKVRPWGATRWQFVPCSREGWIVIALHVATMVGSVLLLLPEPTLPRVIGFLTVVTVATVLLVVIAFRMSPPEWHDK